MDQDLEALRRQAEANPGDADAARRYEQGLLRAGDRARVVARYTFKFLCPYEFEEHGSAQGWNVRHCKQCDEDVHFVRSEEELAERVSAGQCIAVETDELGPLIEGWVDDPEKHSARVEGTRCVVTGVSPMRHVRGRVAPRRLPKAQMSPELQEAVQTVRARRGT